MTTDAIRAEGLTKLFGAVIGVQDLSFDVQRGEVYGFLGANGAGKTTTIRLLLDLLRPSSGRASVMGLDCRHNSIDARRQIGYLPGELPVYPDLTAGKYLDYLAQLGGRAIARAWRSELLERLDVSGVYLERALRYQSHGMKQKIGIIQALMSRPPVLILDEPTSGLDPLMVQAFRELIEHLKVDGSTTVFLSSHVLTEVEATCDRIGLIRGGRLVASGTMDDIRRRAARRMTISFSAPVNGAVSLPPGATVVASAPTRWVVEVQGPAGPVLQAFAHLPIHDVEIAPFRLEDFVVRYYAEN
jgi:ABC-2 type transport system ATP-binding protein